MSKKLVVDHRAENASKLIFPSSPILEGSSMDLQIHHYELAPHEAPKHAPVQDVIVTYNEPEPLSLRRELGGNMTDEITKCGDMMVSPAGVYHSACWDRKITVTLLLLNPGYISKFSFEDIDPDLVELLPHTSQPDLLINGISQSLIKRLDDQLYIDLAASHLAAHLLRHYCSIKHFIFENTHTLSRIELQQVLDYIESRIQEKKLGLAELSSLLNMSPGHFGRLFKASTGICPVNHIIKRRLENVTHLLTNTALTLDEISQQTGFAHKSHLSNAFKKNLRITPGQYRRSL